MFDVLPTRVGMVRRGELPAIGPAGSPHTRGDGPIEDFLRNEERRFSPHAWGWSV